jgi:hypothetical protein
LYDKKDPRHQAGGKFKVRRFTMMKKIALSSAQQPRAELQKRISKYHECGNISCPLQYPTPSRHLMYAVEDVLSFRFFPRLPLQ